MLVLNEAPRLPAGLKALQEWRAVGEVIVVDGGSEDGGDVLAEPMADKLLRSASCASISAVIPCWSWISMLAWWETRNSEVS